MRTAGIKWPGKSVCPCDSVVNAYLAVHRRLGLSTLGKEIYASLNALYGKDRLFKRGGQLGLGSNWNEASNHEDFCIFLRTYTSPPKVLAYPFGLDHSNHRNSMNLYAPIGFGKLSLCVR